MTDKQTSLPSVPSRLPIQHPDYRYSTSSNPYSNRLEEFSDRVFSDNSTEAHSGQWRSLIPDGKSDPRRELHVEIGCNAGHVVVEWAARNPAHAYIGIDWKFKPIFRAAEKTVKRGIQNLLFLRAHADRIKYMFGPDEIDGLYLYFPDPWPKKAQMKNRFFSEIRLRELAGLIRPGGAFHVKTDHPEYFMAMEEAMRTVLAEADCPWELIELTRDLHAGHPDPRTLTIPDVTLFERLFIKDGIKIQSIRLQKRKA
ncbi:MAG: hypothetical protein A2X94_17505 [Bdellovibrionales bacterium GWB1_55_8]|nr:MAG: hypothetical protein A2X94_17505 [Bdellovibrionales bacterium GWB1_55_8]